MCEPGTAQYLLQCATCNKKSTHTCRDCQSVAWCSEQCKHEHWAKEHANVCHVIGNPYHPVNLDKIAHFDNAPNVFLLESALDEALLVAARDPFESDEFIALGNSIADSIANREREDVDDELVASALDWLIDHHEGPDVKQALSSADPKEVLQHLEECIDYSNEKCVNRVMRHSGDSLVNEQMTTQFLKDKHAAMLSLYDKAYAQMEIGNGLTPDVIGAIALIEKKSTGIKKKKPAKYALRKSTRKVRMPSSKSIRSKESKVRRAAQRGANQARKVVRNVKNFAKSQKKALKRTRRDLKRKAGRVNVLGGGGGTLFNPAVPSPNVVYVPQPQQPTYARQPRAQVIVLPQVPGGSAPTRVVTTVSPPQLRVKNQEVLGGIARELADAKTALSLATTVEQKRIAQARVDALQKQWSQIIRL